MKFPMMLAALVAFGTVSLSPADAADLIRWPNAAADAETSRAVELPAGAALVLLSGQTPTPADAAAPVGSTAYWGDTQMQARAAFAKLSATLAGLKLGMGDVAQVRVYLVGDPALGGKPDLAGFDAAWRGLFDARHGAPLPARTLVTVAALGHPGVLVEIEAAALRPAAARVADCGFAPGPHGRWTPCLGTKTAMR